MATISRTGIQQKHGVTMPFFPESSRKKEFFRLTYLDLKVGTEIDIFLKNNVEVWDQKFIEELGVILSCHPCSDAGTSTEISLHRSRQTKPCFVTLVDKKTGPEQYTVRHFRRAMKAIWLWSNVSSEPWSHCFGCTSISCW